MNRDAGLVIMAKQPLVGRTKTRLVPFLTAEEATQIYEALLLDTIEMVLQLSSVADLAVAITPPESRAYFEAITPPGTPIHPVVGMDIGACLEQALGWLLAQGYRKALAINSDGPSLPVTVLQQAIIALEDADLVIGPSEDGGYYLVGMKQLHHEIFESIPWSSAEVLSQTLQRASELGVRLALTQTWYDIDTPADLLRLQAELLSSKGESLAYTRALLARLALEIRPR